METFFLIRNDSHLWINIILIIIAAAAISPYLKWKNLYTPAVKHKHFRLLVYGVIPFLVSVWGGISDIGYTKEFLAASLYFSCYSSILLRQYALIFLRDLPNMPEYPYSEYQIQCLQNIKGEKSIFIIVTIYLFLAGTIILLLL